MPAFCIRNSYKIPCLNEFIELCQSIGFTELVKTRFPAACGEVSERNKNK